MQKSSFSKQHKIRCKLPITLLLFISMACQIFYYFVRTPIMAYSIIDMLHIILLKFSPIVLLILYVLLFYKNRKSAIIVPIVFALYAFNYIPDIISMLHYSYYYSISSYISPCTFIIAYTLAIISTFKRLDNKILVIIPTVYSIAVNLLNLIRQFGFSYFWWFDLFPYLPNLTFNIALLLFCLKNRLPAIFSASTEKEKRRTAVMNPEKALKLLKDDMELGVISENEYQARRAEIIDML